MSALKLIREKTGLSQYQLAVALNVSRSLIYLAEKGLRELPRAARMKLYEMTVSIYNPQQMDLSRLADPATIQGANISINKMAASYKNKMDRCRVRVEQLKEKLKVVSNKQERNSSRMLLLKAVSEENPVKGFMKEGSDKEWISLMSTLTSYDLVKTDQWAQERIKDEIELLEACEKVHRRHWKKWEGFKKEREV